MPVHNIHAGATSAAHDSEKHLLKDLQTKLALEGNKSPAVNKFLAHNASPLCPALSLSPSSVSLHSLTPITSIDSSLMPEDADVTHRPSANESYSNANVFDLFNSKLPAPQTTSILKPGSKFVGSQQSGRSTYEVSIEFKHVDLAKSCLNGFLRIKGLTESYPEIITFFTAEIVSEEFPFLASKNKPSATTYNTTTEIDLQHWSKFPFWKNLSPTNQSTQSFKKTILSDDYVHKDYLSKKYIYMRWKEKFLIPDAKVDNIEGASFAGFYYICLNQLTGDIMGLYYHKNSEKFQQLELNYVQDRGIKPTYQFA
jgi:hypothetical protein